ncbi:MAG TPA: Rap1a/Tai family immunity protein [Stellaceae bacterium]|nr:Rap1a/Tai family immunity protein [Stellaceae bacterium]
MVIRHTILFLATLWISHNAKSEEVSNASGMDLYKQCAGVGSNSESEKMLQYYGCGQYLMGIWDGFVGGAHVGGYEANFCFPASGLTLDSLAKAYVNWANANPQFLQFHQSAAAVTALRSAFPCQR